MPDATPERRLLIHATNVWNPTGRNLLPVADSRLYYTHAHTLGGPRTQVFLGNQQHLSYVAELEGHLPPESIREAVVTQGHVYPHLLDPREPDGEERPAYMSGETR